VWEEISGGAEVIELGDAQEFPRLLRGLQLQGRGPAEEGLLLSGGERNRVHMAKLLKEGGNVLLLDEPTNDLDVETLRALEDALEDFAGCAVVISHDRFFLDRICTHILAFEGEAHVEWFEGNFEDYEEDKKRRLGPDALEPKRIKYKKFAAPALCRAEVSDRRTEGAHRKGRALFRAGTDALNGRKLGHGQGLRRRGHFKLKNSTKMNVECVARMLRHCCANFE
jgi:ABC-type multidrug transport system ATPase subunit